MSAGDPSQRDASLRAGQSKRAWPIEFVADVVRQRALSRELVRRQIKGAHAAHGFGVLWMFVQPMIVVGAMTLVFGVVIGSRLAITEEFPGDYVSYILAGMVPWLVTSHCLARAPSLLVANSGLVKQIVFPVHLLPVAGVLADFAVFSPTIVFLIGYKLIAGGGLTPFVLALPLALALHVSLCLGVSLFLAVTTPFVRDLREIVGVYLAISLYITPAIYLPDWVPAALRPILYFNPASYIVWVYQDLIFFGRIAHGFAWAGLAVLAAAAMIGGLATFRRLRPYVGNVL